LLVHGDAVVGLLVSVEIFEFDIAERTDGADLRCRNTLPLSEFRQAIHDLFAGRECHNKVSLTALLHEPTGYPWDAPWRECPAAVG
jgi:hypothetical protein